MIPPWICLPLPLAELISAGWLWHRRRSYPALVSYLLTEAAWQLLGCMPWHSTAYTWAAVYGQPVRMAFRAWLACEVARISGVRSRRAGAILAAAGISAALGPSFLLAQQYFHIILAAALWGVPCLRERLRIVSAERAAYRWGATVWFTLLAVSRTFVAGGLAYRVMRGTMATFQTAIIVITAAMLLTVCGMTVAMCRHREPSRRAATAAARVAMRAA